MSWQEEQWRRRWQLGERIITWLALGALCLVVGLQIHLAANDSSTPLRGQSFQPVLPANRDDGELFGTLTLEVAEMKSLDLATVYVNGQETLSFHSAQVTIRVYPGDVVEIDASAYRRSLQFRLVSASSNIRTDTLAQTITVQGGRSLVGTVTFK